MKKVEKEYVEEILNEIISSNKKPTQAQQRRLIIALEKIKNSSSNNSYLETYFRLLLKWFTSG